MSSAFPKGMKSGLLELSGLEITFLIQLFKKKVHLSVVILVWLLQWAGDYSVSSLANLYIPRFGGGEENSICT